MSQSHELTAAQQRAARIELMIFDVDGVFTDGRLLYGPQGEFGKQFSTLDGHGVKLLAASGVEVGIITGRRSETVARRAAELGIAHVQQGASDKRVALEALCAATGIAPASCGYMGDDWPDLPVLTRVGCAAAPANAHPEVRQRCHWIAEQSGGAGAVRALCDFVLRARGSYDELLNQVLA